MINLNNPKEVANFITENLGSHKQFALATVDRDGKPWTVCLNLTYDELGNIIWKSEKSTQHSNHILTNPEVAICIFSENEARGDFGLYCRAKAHEVTEISELNRLIKIRFALKGKPIPKVSDFLGESNSRIYYAEIYKMYFNDDKHIKTKVDLSKLRSAIRANWG